MTDNLQRHREALWNDVRCLECLDTGLCWSGTLNNPVHCSFCEVARAGELLLPPAVQIFRRRCFDRMERSADIARLHFYIARTLTLATSDAPCLRETIDDTFGIPKRKSAEVLEHLRRNWLLPIGGRKEAPAGAWIIVTEAEFLEWSRAYRRTAITQLATLHSVTKANFPRLAGQTEFDFVQQITAELEQEVLY